MVTALRFELTPQEAGTELRLMGVDGPRPYDGWAIEAPPALMSAVDRIAQFIANDQAIADNDVVLVEHRAVARLSASEAKALGFGPPAEAVAHVAFSGVLGRPGFGATLEWRNTLGRPLPGVRRIGAWLLGSGAPARLPEALFEAACAVDGIAGATDEAEKMRAAEAFVAYREGASAVGRLRASGLAGSVSIRVASAFTVDLVGEGPQARLRPELMRSIAGVDGACLGAEAQAAFVTEFDRFATARPVYALPNSEFVVLEPAVRRALDVVRRLQDSTSITKHEFMRSPRRFLREALGDDDEALLERVFVETEHFSDRVRGLGLWTKRNLPWASSTGIDWFGDDASSADEQQDQVEDQAAATTEGPAAGTPDVGPRATGVQIGDTFVPVEARDAAGLRERLIEAFSQARPHVEYEAGGKIYEIPADYGMLAELESIANAEQAAGLSAGDGATPPAASSSGKQVLIVASNEDEVEHAAQFRKRPSPTRESFELLRTPLKSHQVEGVAWLRKAWTVGNPGVLLADDMGLGKTLQALAFMAWLRSGMLKGQIVRQPLLVVAPTGLLQNWKAEHDRHLGPSGLGRLTEAFGAGLSSLKRYDDEGVPRLDVPRLASSEWILTTYETLRDYQTEFGRVMFAAILFDEAQKVKTPTVQMTEAAKGMKAQFKVAMTGTPIENRLAELWCIADLVHDACLGSLAEFRRRYELSGAPEAIGSLKTQLELETANTARIMLRRTKRDHLPDLPDLIETPLVVPMPPQQRLAYDAAISSARTAREPGGPLQALQNLLRISLHPDPAMAGDDETFIRCSARLIGLIQVLDGAQAEGRKALVFIDNRALQARLGPLLQRRYRLAKAPLLINGDVGGGMRQARVDAFQKGEPGFDVMLISPRAGGVGLTLTAASIVVHLTRWWNPAVEDQCNGRALRIGQTSAVNVYPLIARHPAGTKTFDENLHELLTRKRELMREALAAPEPTDAEKQWIYRSTLDPGG